jgi:hypothetical protein
METVVGVRAELSSNEQRDEFDADHHNTGLITSEAVGEPRGYYSRILSRTASIVVTTLDNLLEPTPPSF